MKKVFLSLAVIAALTVVSCKQAENAASGADSTAVEDTAVDTTAVDTAAVAAKVETPAS
jgi:hypothetical protein